MKVTRRRLMVLSYREALKMTPTWARGCICSWQTMRLEFYNATLRALINNPNIKW